MSEPLSPVSTEETSRLVATSDGPLINPPVKTMMATNAGIVIFGLAALIFCLQHLFQAFLIAVLIVLGLAIVNLILLTLAWREGVHLRAAALSARVASQLRKS